MPPSPLLAACILGGPKSSKPYSLLTWCHSSARAWGSLRWWWALEEWEFLSLSSKWKQWKLEISYIVRLLKCSLKMAISTSVSSFFHWYLPVSYLSFCPFSILDCFLGRLYFFKNTKNSLACKYRDWLWRMGESETKMRAVSKEPVSYKRYSLISFVLWKGQKRSPVSVWQTHSCHMS